MSVQRAWIASLIAAMLIAGATLWRAHSIPLLPAVVLDEPAPTTAVIDSATRTFPNDDEPWLEPRVDLNGNEIDAAVSDYRVDGRGDMYEAHAPDTALLHLSSPEL